MIDGENLKFGYGDISVFHDNIGRLVFGQFKNCYECGSSNDKYREEAEDCFAISPTLEEFNLFIRYLDSLEKGSKVFNFKGYTFDFSNYNKASVRVVKDVAKHAMKRVYWLYAV